MRSRSSGRILVNASSRAAPTARKRAAPSARHWPRAGSPRPGTTATAPCTTKSRTSRTGSGRSSDRCIANQRKLLRPGELSSSKERKLMSRCVIVSACPVSPELKRLLRPDDLIIACDAGYRNCAPLGCKPNIIVGDFDTAPCPEQQDDVIVLPHVKDDTDTEYAAKLASEKGCSEVLLLGALGGRRLEHTLANLCTGLGLEQRGVRATLQDERSRITFVRAGEERTYPKAEFFYVSVFPLEGRAEGVCERGSYYELTDAVLTAGYPLGVSNEYAEGSDCITISTRKGALVVVETLPDTPILR